MIEPSSRPPASAAAASVHRPPRSRDGTWRVSGSTESQPSALTWCALWTSRRRRSPATATLCSKPLRTRTVVSAVVQPSRPSQDRGADHPHSDRAVIELVERGHHGTSISARFLSSFCRQAAPSPSASRPARGTPVVATVDSHDQPLAQIALSSPRHQRAVESRLQKRWRLATGSYAHRARRRPERSRPRGSATSTWPAGAPSGRRRAAAPRSRACSAASSTAARGRAAPGWRADRRRARAGGWQTNGAARAG